MDIARFSPRSLGGRIMLGYLVLCGLLVGLGFLAYVRMAEISDSFSIYTRNLAEEMRLAQDISAKTLVLRLFANSYVETRSQAALNQFNSQITSLHELIVQAPRIAVEADGHDLTVRLTDLAVAYETVFREVVSLIQLRQGMEYRDLNAIRYRLENLLASVRTAASDSDNPTAFLLLANAREGFSRMLMHSAGYLRHGDERDGVLFDNAQTQVAVAMKGLEQLITDARHLREIGQVQSEAAEYKAVMDNVRRNYQRQHLLVRDSLRNLEEEIEALVDRIVLEIAGQVAERERTSAQFMERIRHEILSWMLLALLAALATSLVVSRGIAGALNRVMNTSRKIAEQDLRALSDNFKMLSSGDLRADLEIAAQPLHISRADEVGRMAAAFDDMILRLRESEHSFAAMVAYLREKARTAAAVARGELDQDVPLASENDALGKALHAMIEHLRISRDEVRRHQDHLAELVAQRTLELDENRRFLANLLSNLPGMAYRSLNDASRTAEFVSQGCLKLTGYQPEDFLGGHVISLSNVVHPDYRQMLRDEWQRALAAKRPLRQEYPIVTASGKEKWVFEQGVGVLNEHGEVLALEGFIIDISDRKRLEGERLDMERSLLHSQKLESLGVLAGGIAHDFNNLLTAMQGNLELALLNTPQDAPWRGRLKQAEKAARQAAVLTRQMLAYSGKGRFLINQIDLNRLVRENVDIFRTSIARTSTLSLRLAPALPLVKADAGQMQQVVMNLITNASEAMEGKPGVMTLATGVMRCDTEYLSRACIEPKPAPGWFVWLEVADQGTGMDEQTCQRLFDPFFSTKFTGRGLGLAAVLGIVRGHGGTIVVHSEHGRGTTFRVLFPVSEDNVAGYAKELEDIEQQAGPPCSGAEYVAGVHAGSLILVVDDEEMVREVCVEALHYLGYETLEAADGMQALHVFKQHSDRIVCVILDLMMPNLDGLGTFAELQLISPTLPVILSSGFNAEEAAIRFQDRRPSGFLQKPYSLDTLKRELENVLVGT